MKQIVRVFPDYCSSGLWGDKVGSGMIDENNFKHVLSDVHLLALKYWHHAWEYSCNDDMSPRFTGVWQEQWEADGKALVAAFNACQDVYEFIYVGDNF